MYRVGTNHIPACQSEVQICTVSVQITSLRVNPRYIFVPCRYKSTVLLVNRRYKLVPCRYKSTVLLVKFETKKISAGTTTRVGTTTRAILKLRRYQPCNGLISPLKCQILKRRRNSPLSGTDRGGFPPSFQNGTFQWANRDTSCV